MPVDPIAPLTAQPTATRVELASRLEHFTSRFDTAGLDVCPLLRSNAAVAGILEEANAGEHDLIVLGTHGYRGFERWVLGSVAEEVLRKAPCPVLTVPPRVGDPPAEALQMFKSILCPIDFSGATLRALDVVFHLAREADAEVLLLHVVDGAPDSEHWLTRPSIGKHLRALEEHSVERLRAIVPDDARLWCRPETLVVRGKAHQEILRIASTRNVQLIVIGVHRRRALERLFIGSTTYDVVRNAGCPVLTLKP